MSYNGSDEEEEKLYAGLGGVSYKFLWQNISSFPTPQETFCDVYGPQFNTAELDVKNAFENISHIALVQLIVNETQQICSARNFENCQPILISHYN
jgi:hypothetical protein